MKKFLLLMLFAVCVSTSASNEQLMEVNVGKNNIDHLFSTSNDPEWMRATLQDLGYNAGEIKDLMSDWSEFGDLTQE